MERRSGSNERCIYEGVFQIVNIANAALTLSTAVAVVVSAYVA